MNELVRDVNHIVPLTYGLMPRGNTDGYRLTVDSALAITAAQRLYSSIRQTGGEAKIFIPGATIFDAAVDAEYMKQHITHPKRSPEHRVPNKDVQLIASSLNTPTQMEEIKRLQDLGELNKVVLICASWQEEDARQLMENFDIQGKLYTDEIILKPEYENFFTYQEHNNLVYRTKKEGPQAKAFKILNRIDRKGKLRTIMARTLGVGVADWGYRGFARGAHAWIEEKNRKKAERKRDRKNNKI